MELACRAWAVVGEPPIAVRYLAESSSTALGHACFWGSANLAAFLLGARADPRERNRRGCLPAERWFESHFLCELSAKHEASKRLQLKRVVGDALIKNA